MGLKENIMTGVAVAALLGGGVIVALTFLPAVDDGVPRAAPETAGAPQLSFARLTEPPLPSRMDSVDPLVRELIEEKMAIVQADPENADNWATLGVVYHANDMLDVAGPCYETTISLAPDMAPPRYWLATCQYRTGDVEGAIATMRSMIAVDPSYSPAHWRLGGWLLDEGDLAGAEAAYRRSISVNPQDGGGWHGLADIYVRKDEPEKAITIIRDRLLGGPGDAYSRQLLARAYRATGQNERAAIEVARSAPGQAPWFDRWGAEITNYWTGRAGEAEWARQYMARQRPDLAAQHLQKVLDHFPEDVSALNNFSVALGSMERYDEALTYLQKAREVDPANALTYLNLARIEYNRGIRGATEREDPLDLVEHAIELDPERQDSFEFLSFLYERRGLKDESLLALAEAAQHASEPSEALLKLADKQGENGDLETAMSTVERVLAINPASVGAYFRLIMLQIHFQRYDEARALLETAEDLLDAATDPRIVDARKALEDAESGAGTSFSPLQDSE
jgi:tetratricopeptide (TPR) repeat protein